MDASNLKALIIKSALKLAEERRWQDVSLLDIATHARCSLGELRDQFGSKGAILRALSEQIDDLVLRRPPEREEGQSVRDSVFDVVMARFDALLPYKAALKSIYLSGQLDAGLFAKLVDSQRWMLAAAGAPADGLPGAVRTVGLTAVYGLVFRTWLDDDDPGMAKTMSVLDRRLRDGERVLSAVDEVAGLIGRAATALWGSRGPAEPHPGEAAAARPEEPQPGPATPGL